MENKIIEWEDSLVGKARDVARYLLDEHTKMLYRNKNYILEEAVADLTMLVVDLKTLYELDDSLVKVSENPMGGYYIVELKEIDKNG